MARLQPPRFLAYLVLSLVVWSGTSCRHGDHEPTYQVKGKVLYKGRPAEWAQVMLWRVGGTDAKQRHPGGQVQNDGTFRLSTYASYDGAPAGHYAVTIVYPSPAKKIDDENAGPDLLQGRYADPKTTPLSVEIKAGENQLESFQLK